MVVSMRSAYVCKLVSDFFYLWQSFSSRDKFKQAEGSVHELKLFLDSACQNLFRISFDKYINSQMLWFGLCIHVRKSVCVSYFNFILVLSKEDSFLFFCMIVFCTSPRKLVMITIFLTLPCLFILIITAEACKQMFCFVTAAQGVIKHII